ncbi:MAG: hypothetical protein KC646_01245 [Candidatus Cloacimonetes bacterium]|nr:hypothetical protein [Candidatus Cloacimonadota bacterium]
MIKNNKFKLLFAVVLILSYFAWDAYINSTFKRVIPASFVTEFCSCYYVEKQSQKHCEWYSSQIISVSDYHIDEDKKAITAHGLHEEALAVFKNDRLGCVLMEEK